MGSANAPGAKATSSLPPPTFYLRLRERIERVIGHALAHVVRRIGQRPGRCGHGDDEDKLSGEAQHEGPLLGGRNDSHRDGAARRSSSGGARSAVYTKIERPPKAIAYRRGPNLS